MSEAESAEATERDDAGMAVANARSLRNEFEDESTELRYGAIKHAIAELENARRALPEEY